MYNIIHFMFNITKLFLFFYTCFFITIYTYSIQDCDYYNLNRDNICKILAKNKYDDTKYTYKKRKLEDIFIDLNSDKIKTITTNTLLKRILYNNCLGEEVLMKYLNIIQDDKLSHSHYMQKYLIYGYILSKQKRYLDAINIFLQIHQKCTHDKYKQILNFYLAYNYYKIHKYDQAYQYMVDFYNNLKNSDKLKHKLKNDFNKKQTLLLMLILLNKCDNEKMEQIINLTNNEKEHYDEYILTTLGDYYSSNREYMKAINCYKSALSLTKDEQIKHNILLKKIIAHYNGNDINEVKTLKQDIKKNILQLDCKNILQYAILLICMENYEDALYCLQNCNSDINNADILFMKAICYYNIGNIKKTITILKEIKDNYQQYNLIDNVNMLYVYLNYNEINYNHIVDKLSHNNINCKNNTNKIITTIWQINQLTNAINAYKKKDYNRSLSIAQDLLKYDIDTIDIYNMLNLLCAEIYYILTDYNQAIQYYTKVLENTHIIKMKFQVLYGLGYCYFATKQYENALECFEKISLNQYYCHKNIENDIQIMISDSLLHLKEYKKAEDIYKKLKHKTLHSQYHLGIAYVKQNKTAEAINTFKEILEKCTNIPKIMYYKTLNMYINCFENDDEKVNFIKTESMQKKKINLNDINNIIFEILKKRQKIHDIDLFQQKQTISL